MENIVNQFRTKTGVCEINKENIILKRNGVRGDVAEKVVGKNINKLLRMYSILGLSMLAIGVYLIFTFSYFYGALVILFGLYLLISVFKSKNNSTTPIIKIIDIENIKAKPPIPLLTRGYFKIYFKENETIKIRIILLPGIFSSGNTEYIKALKIMQDSGLIKKK